ncbi:UNVERIFIED_CONTAM: hypothetical protein Slati_1202900 [Sesamum latifolium]|uniref:Uncharacterized protein n=1 Tax=Sesamum latifolium TaxID=2727402 RepID=A0AAW2XE14_9LAMI
MPSATPTAAAAAAVSGLNHNSTFPLSFKTEVKPFSQQTSEMLDPSSSSSSGPIRIAGSEHDAALSKSEFLTRPEVINRRARRVKQLARIYRDHYWALMEELKLKYREYYWEYGKSPFVDDEENEKMNSNRGIALGQLQRILVMGIWGLMVGMVIVMLQADVGSMGARRRPWL